MLLATWGTALNILVFAALVAAVIYLSVSYTHLTLPTT